MFHVSFRYDAPRAGDVWKALGELKAMENQDDVGAERLKVVCIWRRDVGDEMKFFQ